MAFLEELPDLRSVDLGRVDLSARVHTSNTSWFPERKISRRRSFFRNSVAERARTNAASTSPSLGPHILRVCDTCSMATRLSGRLLRVAVNELHPVEPDNCF